MIERPEHGPALLTIKLDIFKLGEHPAPPRDDTRHSNQVVEVRPAKVAEGGAEWEICNADVYFGMDTLVGRIVDQDGIESHFIEDSKHGRG